MLNTKYIDQDNLFELIIFQGYKNLVFYWNFAKGMVTIKSEIQDLLKQNRIQNIYGVSEGLKGFSQAFSSEPITNFKYFQTSYFKFTIYEMCSGVKIILLSNISDQTDYSETLKEVYTNYLEIIKRNPFYVHGEPLDNPLFIEKLQIFLSHFKRKSELNFYKNQQMHYIQKIPFICSSQGIIKIYEQSLFPMAMMVYIELTQMNYNIS